MGVVDMHALTPRPDRRDGPVFRFCEYTVTNPKNVPASRQHNCAAMAVALKVHILEFKFAQIAEPAEIKKLLESGQCVDLVAGGIKQRQIQRNRTSRHVFFTHIDLASDTVACDQRADGHIFDILNVAQGCWCVRRIARARSDGLVVPCG